MPTTQLLETAKSRTSWTFTIVYLLQQVTAAGNNESRSLHSIGHELHGHISRIQICTAVIKERRVVVEEGKTWLCTTVKDSFGRLILSLKPTFWHLEHRHLVTFSACAIL